MNNYVALSIPLGLLIVLLVIKTLCCDQQGKKIYFCIKLNVHFSHNLISLSLSRYENYIRINFIVFTCSSMKNSICRWLSTFERFWAAIYAQIFYFSLSSVVKALGRNFEGCFRILIQNQYSNTAQREKKKFINIHIESLSSWELKIECWLAFLRSALPHAHTNEAINKCNA